MINNKIYIKLAAILVVIITFIILLVTKTLAFQIIEMQGLISIILLTVCIGCLLFVAPTKKLYGVDILGSDAIAGNDALDYLTIFMSALLFVQIIFALFFFPAIVNQSSMYPNYRENDKILIVNGNKNIDRFDVIVFKTDKDKLNLSYSDKDGELWIKRVIGLPGEQINYINGHLYVNNDLIEEKYLMNENNGFLSGTYLDHDGYPHQYNCYTNNFSTTSLVAGGIIPDDYFLVLGDNRSGNPYSHDSREVGLVHRSLIIGEGKYVLESILSWKKIGD